MRTNIHKKIDPPFHVVAPYKKLDKDDANKKLQQIATDLPKRWRKRGLVSGGSGEGGALYPRAFLSGMRTESVACGGSPYHHGGMVWIVSLMMVIGRVVNQWCCWHEE